MNPSIYHTMLPLGNPVLPLHQLPPQFLEPKLQFLKSLLLKNLQVKAPYLEAQPLTTPRPLCQVQLSEPNQLLQSLGRRPPPLQQQQQQLSLLYLDRQAPLHLENQQPLPYLEVLPL